MPTTPFDPYYSRSEVSNSDLTSLKYKLHPQLDFVKDKDRTKAFRMGTLVDALVTEPTKANHFRKTVDDEQYTDEEWKWGKAQLEKLRKAAKKDPFLDHVLKHADGQKWFTNPCQHFDVGCYSFDLATRCKFDWWLGFFGGDLKTTTATSQSQFENAIDFFEWDRSRAWYMDLTNSINPLYGNQDFIYAVSKTANKVFFKKIIRGDETYERGREKYLELAFKYWLFV
jgi:hypothetical protein